MRMSKRVYMRIRLHAYPVCIPVQMSLGMSITPHMHICAHVSVRRDISVWTYMLTHVHTHVHTNLLSTAVGYVCPIHMLIRMPIYMPTCMPMHMSLHTPTQVLHTCGYGCFCTHVYMHVLSQAAEDGVHDFHMEYAGLQVLHERGFLTLNKLE